MSAPLHAAVVTGSRAEYGLLHWPLRDMEASADFRLSLIVTGTHLSSAHGHTVSAIEADGFDIAARVELGLDGDERRDAVRAVGQAANGCADAFLDLEPDVVIVLGDRYEILGAVQAAVLLGIPVVHLCGGDVTEGAFDDSLRHAITKLSHVHLVSNPESAARVRQMGEAPERVHMVGNPGLDHILRADRMGQAELETSLCTQLGERNYLFTFHPVTMESDLGLGQLQVLLGTLGEAMRPSPGRPDAKLFLTGTNCDPGYAAIARTLESFVEANPTWAHLYDSLGQRRYLSLMGHVDAVIGNSSSGLLEAPSFATWTLNVGNRQTGRLAGDTVLNCEATRLSILAALERAAAGPPPSGSSNPYGDGQSSKQILDVLRALPSRSELLHKRFHDLSA